MFTIKSDITQLTKTVNPALFVLRLAVVPICVNKKLNVLISLSQRVFVLRLIMTYIRPFWLVALTGMIQ